MRLLMPLMCALLLVACGPQAAGTEPPQPLIPTVPVVAELLAGAAPGPIQTVGYLFVTDEGAALIDGLSLGGPEPAAPLSSGGIWLGPIALPEDAPANEAGAARYVIVEASGLLEGPGSYGPAGRYSYALAEPRIKGRSPRDLTIAALLANSASYEGQPVRLRGQLLTSPDTALLVESLSPGGVPDANARQVKLAAAPADPAVNGQLKRSANGRLSYGPVELIGIWRAGALYPLAVRADTG